MAAIITTAIPALNYELIRDQIGAVIALEYANQYDLNNNLPHVDTVDIERCIPYDGLNEIPAINVTASRGEYGNRTVTKRIGDYTYNIDCYTSAASTPDDSGDKLALIHMHRMLGVISQILSHPDYTTLGLAPGIVQGIPKVERIFIGDKTVVEDALSNIVGRIQLSVSAIETTDGIITGGVPLKINSTQTKMLDPVYGFYYKVENLDV